MEMHTSTQEYRKKRLMYFMKIEKKLLHKPLIDEEWRQNLVNWMMEVSVEDPNVVQWACWYMDSYLDIKKGVRRLKIVAAASLLIARSLSRHEYDTSEIISFVAPVDSYADLMIKRDSILVLLDYASPKIGSLQFIKAMAKWCDKNSPDETERAATFICMCGLMVRLSLSLDYPSVIAAASVRTALVLLKKKCLIKRLQTCTLYITALKKTSNFKRVEEIVYEAVKFVGRRDCELLEPLKQYGTPPSYVAQRVVKAAYGKL